ncbi:hypothetical protein [Shewanella baltica]|nr:hypothetical protein [Shewanella baltica]ADT94409.1 hypothetical protein Sbal678_2253 [Shewanella baltica OS678]
MKCVISFETMLSRSFECGEAQEYLKERLGEGGYNKCNRWDTLTTRGGFTPQKCDFCVGEDGVNKNIYYSEQEALLYSDVTLKEEGIRLRVYKCPHGFGWHRTKKLS